jgi:hypothetical protein
MFTCDSRGCELPRFLVDSSISVEVHSPEGHAASGRGGVLLTSVEQAAAEEGRDNRGHPPDLNASHCEQFRSQAGTRLILMNSGPFSTFAYIKDSCLIPLAYTK